MQIVTLPDITAASGAAAPLSSTPQLVKWVLVEVISSTASVRFGDSNTALASRGFKVATGAYFFAPQDTSDLTARYDLAKIYYSGTAADVISVTYAI